MKEKLKLIERIQEGEFLESVLFHLAHEGVHAGDMAEPFLAAQFAVQKANGTIRMVNDDVCQEMKAQAEALAD